MSLHSDLIEQAEHLAKREPKRPRQASLRRAISNSYYAVFHMLVDEGATRLIPSGPEGLRAQAARAFTHREMKRACEQFTKPNNPFAHLLVGPLEAELGIVAARFVELQQLRHSADYDLAQSFDRPMVLRIIDQAKTAMSAWKKVRSKPNANVFLTALLLASRWNR